MRQKREIFEIQPGLDGQPVTLGLWNFGPLHYSSKPIRWAKKNLLYHLFGFGRQVSLSKIINSEIHQILVNCKKKKWIFSFLRSMTFEFWWNRTNQIQHISTNNWNLINFGRSLSLTLQLELVEMQTRIITYNKL